MSTHGVKEELCTIAMPFSYTTYVLEVGLHSAPIWASAIVYHIQNRLLIVSPATEMQNLTVVGEKTIEMLPPRGLLEVVILLTGHYEYWRPLVRASPVCDLHSKIG